MRVEPRVGDFAVIAHDLAARGRHRRANPVVHQLGRVGLRLGHIGGNIRVLIHGILGFHKLEHERARQNRLRLQRFLRPVGAHFAREHAFQIAFNVHLHRALVVQVIHVQYRHAVFVQLQLFRKLRRLCLFLRFLLCRRLHAAGHARQHQRANRQNRPKSLHEKTSFGKIRRR